MSVVFHIAARAEWEAAIAAGTYRTGSLDTEGFIHCSTGEQISATANTLFARRTDLVHPDRFLTDPTFLEVFLEEADDDLWRFRRQLAIARPLTELGAVTPRGTPFIRPEVGLLYKAKHLRFKDQRDFDASAPTLDATAHAWLTTALEHVHPGHPWAALAGPRPR